MKKTIATALIFGSLTVLAPAAHARDGISAGGAAALGVLGGLAVGGAIAASNDAYYPGRPVYRAPRPVYVEEDVGPVCHFERRRIIDPYGDVYFRRVRVCE
ncbi:hypothetical protein [Methylobacterium gnaphalii]|uniref:Uncharacterized protein n=1 Tax=Methylobacterium gnaphalii TaxID=1010610 RepID=A0A512JF61_9HYPH|nr:hypothetical protein [Methylobacterium gnaphalii]GEP08590.1 hypothetical protein MGN01_04350 [Methylobacterium gnaphalii]GJD70575.1 hypothetical protein MMMDOFMJ_3524 [Methylobacterium gnaphalii]GLS50807.1 hypothetical protein GCM10007885_36610 [Methylobacterium gnaphalii]